MTTLRDFENRLQEFNKEFAEFKKHYRKKPEIGEEVEIAGIQWRVLDKLESGYFAIMEGFDSLSTEFDSDTNDWQASNLRNYLNTEFLKKLEGYVGELPEFERDLTSLDGQTEYGKCEDKVSLLTVDEYRKYRKYLPNTDKWWWLCTPWSTKCNGYKYPVTVVAPSGYIYDYCYGSGGGVRPVCIFPSSIFESEEESRITW